MFGNPHINISLERDLSVEVGWY